MSDTNLPTMSVPEPGEHTATEQAPVTNIDADTDTTPVEHVSEAVPQVLPPTPPPEPKQAQDGTQEPAKESAATQNVQKFDNEARARAIAKRRAKREEKLNVILSYVREHGSIVNDEIQAITGVSDNTALMYAKLLVKEGCLVRLGKGVGTRYALPTMPA